MDYMYERSSHGSNSVDNASREADTVASASESADSHSLPLPFGEYEVFLNFRGPDTRYQITDILYRFLVNLKIHTFKDDDELRKGEGMWPNLVEAIEQAKIYVPIFSENYAYSKWCLKELVAIVERQEGNQGCIILPIFYMVDPKDVRHQSGPYWNAFEEHKKIFDEETILVWRDALNKIGAMKGWHVKSSDEQGAIADLVTGDVWSHLSKNNNVLETDKLIGIDGHIEAVEERMTLDSGGVSIVGIHGIGGIGKTTIAKAFYNKVSAQFDRCSFVESVREILLKKDGVMTLQKQLISDILRRNSVESIANISEGIKVIRNRITRFKCLIVLDDVDEKFEIEEVLGNIENFVSGSRFVMTSRNVKVLSTLTTECKLYKVLEMTHGHSLQLFCKHAFKMDSPSGFETLSKDIVSVAAGLPLTLKVVGSLLFQEEKVIWEDKLRQLKEIPEEEVVERLRISYDSLNEEAKQIFLDVACYFVGDDKEIPSYMWSSCGFFPVTNINILNQRSMIEIVCDIEKQKVFRMHDQLRDMGREIVRQENKRHPWNRSRIWSEEKAMDMLHNKKGTNIIECIRMNSSSGDGVVEELEIVGNFESECFMNLSEVRFIDVQAKMLPSDFADYLPNLRWFRWKFGYGGCMPKFHAENMVILELLTPVKDDWGGLRHLMKMARKLKVLKLVGKLLIEYPDFPRSLEILYLQDFGPRLSHKDLDIGNLRNLKVLHLWYCEVGETRGGTIGMVKGLQELNIIHLGVEESLRATLADIGDLQFLEILRVDVIADVGLASVYENLLLNTKLPTSLKELETTSPVANLPELVELDELVIRYSGYGLEIPPADSSDMWWKSSKLKSLSLQETNMTMPTNTSSPSSLPLLPSSLTTLHVKLCPKLEWLPNLKNLEYLTHLYISGCPLLKEIPGLGGLKSLETLSLSDLKAIYNLDGLDSLCSLTSLTLKGCDALGRLPSLVSLKRLKTLSVSYAPFLREIEGLAGLKSLEQLNLYDCGSLVNLAVDELSGLKQLRRVEIKGCSQISFIDISTLRKLEPNVKIVVELPITNKQKVLDFSRRFHTKLPNLAIYGSLEMLNLSEVRVRSEDLDIGNLSNLKVLLLMNCAVREILGGTIGMLKGLRELNINGFCCNNSGEVFADIGGLQSLKILKAARTNMTSEGSQMKIKLPTSLTVLHTSFPIANLSELVDLEELAIEYGIEIPPADHMFWKLSKLNSLKLYNAAFITTTSCGGHPASMLFPSSLTRLSIRRCRQLDGFLNLENLENLIQLSIVRCPMLEEIHGLGGMKSLESLKLDGGANLLILNGLDSLHSLKNLSLFRCKALERLPSLASLSKLCNFNVFDCPRLSEIQGLEGLKSLEVLSISGAGRLTHLHGFVNLLSLNKLQTLIIWDCPRLAALSSHDQQLDGGGSSGDSQPVLDSLRRLSINGCASLLQGSFCQMLRLSRFPRLVVLELGQTGPPTVTNEIPLEGLESLEDLVSLRLICLATQKLPSLSKLQKLNDLTVIDASNLREIEGLADLKSLRSLTLERCTSLERLSGLDLKSLQILHLVRCTSLERLPKGRGGKWIGFMNWWIGLVDPWIKWIGFNEFVN
ncbi:unnamed protein product [Linum trigynum]|uniref:TIR domain-containing protein n=1 Tax=Linum trigynum TaxID=586398 RepID=A0AAV2DR01_9ROSI